MGIGQVTEVSEGAEQHKHKQRNLSRAKKKVSVSDGTVAPITACEGSKSTIQSQIHANSPRRRLPILNHKSILLRRRITAFEGHRVRFARPTRRRDETGGSCTRRGEGQRCLRQDARRSYQPFRHQQDTRRLSRPA